MNVLIASVLLCFGLSVINTSDDPLVLDVWPAGKMPSESGKFEAEKALPERPGERKVVRLTNITRPTLTIYRPAEEKNTGTAVVVCPGGGYHILAWDLEGTEVAQWLNSIGVTAIVLKYRVPRRPGTPNNQPPIQPLQDAQRAMSLVRSKASELGIDPQRIGILGFSAGGHLAASTATNFDKRAYDHVDDVDNVSCRPNFAVLVYPAYLVSKDNKSLNPDIRVSKDTPPVFFAHAADDPLTPENSIRMYQALRQAKVPAELHIYSRGGHGFGLRPSFDPCYTWPQRCAEWMRAMGWISDNASK